MYWKVMESEIRIFPTPFELAEAFAGEFVSLARAAEKEGKVFTVALSGGNTPGLFFSVLADHFSNAVNWNMIHLFWGDERCVPADHSESNYGTVRHILLEKIDIPGSGIHRIRGENSPLKEALRYSEEIKDHTLLRNGLPVFDIVLLGLGEDGHTASIFQGANSSFGSENICEVAAHPFTGQKRITITGSVINNALNVVFLVTGRNKASVVEKIIRKRKTADKYPAYHVKPVNGRLAWYLDREAGELIT
jgi:6-phosphogluconolactonase